MYDKVFVALVGTLCGAGGFVAGALVRQPEINKLQKQVACLQADVEELKQVAAEQNDEIKQMLLNYRALGVFAFQQKKELRPLMMEKHGHDINAMRECDLQSTFDRIEQYNEEKAENRKGHGFFRLKK